MGGKMNAGFYQDLGIGGMGVGFAKGGVIHRPTVFPMAGGMGLMGEAGPEAVMPLQRDASGNLGVSGGGGGGGPTIIIQAVDSQSFSDLCAKNPNAIIGPIDKALKGNSSLRHTIRQTR
jgi:phage-related minor tail protein